MIFSEQCESEQCEFDPLDLEILERALDGTLEAMRDQEKRSREDDAALEVALRCDLIEIARWHGADDPERLCDMLLAQHGRKDIAS